MPQITEIPKRLNCIIGTSRYAMVDNLNVGEKKVHELEIGEVISFQYKHYGRYYDLKCSILNNSKEDVIPGTINEDISSTFNESKKRIITSSLTEDVNVKKSQLNLLILTRNLDVFSRVAILVKVINKLIFAILIK